jgi:hypothetical protein
MLGGAAVSVCWGILTVSVLVKAAKHEGRDTSLLNLNNDSCQGDSGGPVFIKGMLPLLEGFDCMAC